MAKQINGLTKNSFLSIFLNIFIYFFDFVLIFLLANFLGPLEFGKYIILISLIKFIGLPILVGYPYFILRKSSYIKSNKRKENNYLLIRNIYLIMIYLIFILLIVFLIQLWDQNLLNVKINLLLFGIITIIPTLSLNNSISSVIRTSSGEIKGQTLEKLIPNVLFILLTLIFVLLFGLHEHNISIYLYSTASILTLVLSLIKIKGICWTNFKFKEVIKDIKDSKIIVFIQIFVLFNNLFPLIILSFFETPEVVGKYKLALQISAISGLGLHAINKIVQPRFAKCFSNKDFSKIQKIAIDSNRITIIYYFLISILIFFSYEKFISIFFGTDFLISKITFLIILLIPFINSLFGSVGAIIDMSGKEIETFKWYGIALFIGLLSNLLLIPIIGINGAAFSTLIECSIRGFALWKQSFKLLKVNSSFLLNEIFKY